ncbi:MAG: hypothetical protein LBT54_01520 [Bifidobacteriaceae bacterium]|nr:hypothetical protein [Bifidobacteriaceae bacterium]
MTDHDKTRTSAVQEMEAAWPSALDLAAARVAVGVSALLGRAFEASGLQGRQPAKRLGVTEGRVSQVLHGDGNIRVATLGRYLKAMGFRPTLVAKPLDGRQAIQARPRVDREGRLGCPSAIR